jgi:hypothetical protein
MWWFNTLGYISLCLLTDKTSLHRSFSCSYRLPSEKLFIETRHKILWQISKNIGVLVLLASINGYIQCQSSLYNLRMFTLQIIEYSYIILHVSILCNFWNVLKNMQKQMHCLYKMVQSVLFLSISGHRHSIFHFLDSDYK